MLKCVCRFVTKVRYVVEDRNGKIKSFGALNKTIQNKMLPHIINDVRISAALINCFYDLPKSDSNDDTVIIQEIL